MNDHSPSIPRSATAIAHPNIALIKYWGNRDESLRLPSNGSISMNLHALKTKTTVDLDPTLDADVLWINNEFQSGAPLDRVRKFLEAIRRTCGSRVYLKVTSQNNFPASAGIASSASAFAALAAAASSVYGLDLSTGSLSRLARTGSGSACRSVPDGITEWLMGTSDQDSYAVSIAPVDHWDLHDCIAITQSGPKEVGSTAGHQLADTSPLQQTRTADAPRRLNICRSAILQQDFDMLAKVVELDSNMLHAVMLTSDPSLVYWNAASIEVIHRVRQLRSSGVPCAYTLDAGPNVHIICLKSAAELVEREISDIHGVETVILSGIGTGVRLVASGKNN